MDYEKIVDKLVSLSIKLIMGLCVLGFIGIIDIVFDPDFFPGESLKNLVLSLGLFLLLLLCCMLIVVLVVNIARIPNALHKIGDALQDISKQSGSIARIPNALYKIGGALENNPTPKSEESAEYKGGETPETETLKRIE